MITPKNAPVNSLVISPHGNIYKIIHWKDTDAPKVMAIKIARPDQTTFKKGGIGQIFPARFEPITQDEDNQI
jgi:hypothetical protein